jgi:hypothetical protein
MQQIYLDFVDEPKDSARRKRKGIYEKYDINIGKGLKFCGVVR